MTQAQAMITGQKSQADRLEEGIVQYLADQNSSATAWRVDATFGVFGSLPMLGVTFDDAIVLLDATEGNLDGPFDLDSPLDATALLAQHAAYATGTTVGYVNANGCPIVAAPRWVPWPVPGPPMVPGLTPPVPLPHVPTPPRAPSTIPGNPTPWTCITKGVGPTLRCECTSMEYWQDPTTPPLNPLNVRIRVRTVCTYPLTACTGATFPATPSPAPPPPAAAPPVIVPTLTPTCVTHFEW